MNNAQRFLWRWNLRILRREWRQYLLLLVMLTTAVTISVVAVLSTYNAVEQPENRYGKGEVIASLSGDATLAQQALTDQGHRFGLIEKAKISPEGESRKIDIQVVDPQNTITKPLISLRNGNWPTQAGEIAVTDAIGIENTAIGTIIELADQPYRIVGLVENPTDLTEEFLLATNLDQFGIEKAKQTSNFIVDAQPADVTFPAGTKINLASRELLLDIRTMTALAVNTITALAMVEVALLIGAGFAVIARRRSKQYGLLGAVGASPKQIRSAATLSGTIVGIVGAAVGATLGTAIAAFATPNFETAVKHRIDFTVPWWTIVPSVVLAIVAASIAARWPAKSLSKLPIAHMLSAMRPQPAPVKRASITGSTLAIAGGAGIAFGFARLNTLLAAGGIIIAPIGLLLLSPLLIKILGSWAKRLPLTPRMAGRAIARHNRRSAAVVAALAIALAIPVGIVVVTSSLDQKNEAQPPNLATDTAILWLPGVEQQIPHIPASLLTQDNRDLANELQKAAPNATIAPITVAVSPDEEPEQETFDRIGSQSSVIPFFGAKTEDENCFNCDSYSFADESNEIVVGPLETWVATPLLLQTLGIDSMDASTTVLTRNDEIIAVANGRDLNNQLGSSIRVDTTLPSSSSLADAFLSPEAVDNAGLKQVTIGWLAINNAPFDTQIKTAISGQLSDQVFAEFYTEPQPKSSLRLISLLAGLLIALGIAASAVSLFAAESAQDLQVLRSIGAAPITARKLSASMAAILTGAGAIVAVGIGYLALVPLLTVKEGGFPFVLPWLELSGLLIGFPLLAALAGWVSTRTPSRRSKKMAALLLVVAVFAASCTNSTPDANSTTSEPLTAQEQANTCDPKMEQALQTWEKEGFAGSITVLGGDRPCSIGLGIADRETNREITSETSFSIGSVTKAVTAAAIIKLADEGVVSVDEPVGTYVDGLSGDVTNLTIKNLLLHTSGLTGHHGEDHVAISKEETLDAISALDITSEQGKTYSYTNAGYTLLALVVESVTEQGYRGYLIEEILRDENDQPIGGFWDGEPAVSNRAIGYNGNEPGVLGDFAGPHWALDGNGGVAMTTLEMAQWTRALFGAKIFSPEGLTLFDSIQKRQPSGEIELSGWAEINDPEIGEKIITTSGGGGSIYHTMEVAWLPESQRVVAVAVSATSYNTNDMLRLVAQALLSGTGIPTPPPITTPAPKTLEQLVGSYQVGANPDDAIELNIDELDSRGLLVRATGPEAAALVFPSPLGFEGEIERHEKLATSFMNGETAEGERVRDELEQQLGFIAKVNHIYTSAAGELTSYFELVLDTGETRTFALAVNEQGGSESFGLDAFPTGWFASSEKGFSLYIQPELDAGFALEPTVWLRSTTEGGLQVESPDGLLSLPQIN